MTEEALLSSHAVAPGPPGRETVRALTEQDRNIPIAVDIDGTLVSSNLMLESVVILAKTRPIDLLKLPLWSANGRAQLKHCLAATAMPDVRTLPYNRPLIEYLREQKSRGRSIVLATAADGAVARRIAGELGFFDAVYASDGITNLKGEQKRARLVAEFGAKGFDYAGDSASDHIVWDSARKAIIVGKTANAIMRRSVVVDRTFLTPGFGIDVLSKALRVQHWFKNALVFLPLVFVHRLYDVASLAHALIAFLAFCFCASAVYLLNDLLDLPHDRVHPHKKGRMLASGRLSIGHALALIPALLVAATAVAFAQSAPLLLLTGAYWLLMLAYCFKLRDILVLDVVTLASGYTLRVTAGAAANGLAVATSLVAFSMLFFFGLALLKRYAELVTMRSLGRTRARAYLAHHAGLVAFVGCGSSYLGLVILAYQLASVHQMSGRYALIWLVFPLLLFWLAHIWLMARGGRIVSDPVAFALTDRSSRIVAALAAAAVLVST